MTKVCPNCGGLCPDTEPNLCYSCTLKSGQQIVKWHEDLDRIMKRIDDLGKSTNDLKKSLDSVKGFDLLNKNELLIKENSGLKRHLDTTREFYDRLSKRLDPYREEIKQKDEKIKDLEEELAYHRAKSDIVDNLYEQAEEIIESQKRLNEIYKDKNKKNKEKDDEK